MNIIRHIVVILLTAFCSLSGIANTRFDYFFHAATQYRLSSQFSDALALYNHCLEINPDAPEALFAVGRTNLILHNDSLGIAQIRRAVEIDSLNPDYHELLASTYLQLREDDLARPHLECLARLQPRRTDVLTELENYYKKRGLTQEAIKALDGIERIDGASAAITEERFLLHMAEEDSVAAFSQFERFCINQPYDFETKLRLAALYQSRGNEQRADELIKDVRTLDPTNTTLFMLRLQRYDENHQDSLLTHLSDSLINEESIPAEMRRTLLQIRISRSSSMEETIPLFERILDIFPNDEIALQYLMEYYGRENNLEKLEEICRRGVNYHPENLGYSYFLALCIIENEDYEQIASILRKGLDLCDRPSTRRELLSEVFGLMGDCLFQMKQEDDGFLAYDSALVYNRNNVDVLNNYAYYLSEKGLRLDEAEYMSLRSLQGQTSNRNFVDTYAWILFKQGKYQDARRYIERVVSSTLADKDIMDDSFLSSNIIEHAGDIMWHCNESEQALRFWRLALEKDTEKNTILRKKVKKKKYIK